jgi:hypothetical protein
MKSQAFLAAIQGIVFVRLRVGSEKRVAETVAAFSKRLRRRLGFR